MDIIVYSVFLLLNMFCNWTPAGYHDNPPGYGTPAGYHDDTPGHRTPPGYHDNSPGYWMLAGYHDNPPDHWMPAAYHDDLPGSTTQTLEIPQSSGGTESLNAP